MLHSTEKRRRQLRKLFLRQQGLCHWCAQKMIWRATPLKKHERPNHRDVTYEHLDSRLSPERGNHKNEYRNVAACWSCNTRRARVEQAALPKEVLWERSKRHPRSTAPQPTSAAPGRAS